MTSFVLRADSIACVGTSDVAFEALFAAEYPRVVAIAYRIVADRADAEDVAQEAFAQLARAHHVAAERAAGWLAVAAVHHALNLIRSRKRRIARELADFRLQDPIREHAVAGDPPAIVDRAHANLLVRAAMLRLPARSAEILALRYGGASYREIAAALAIGVTQVGTRLVRAECALRKELERGAR